jgi:hypothetical protein
MYFKIEIGESENGPDQFECVVNGERFSYKVGLDGACVEYTSRVRFTWGELIIGGKYIGFIKGWIYKKYGFKFRKGNEEVRFERRWCSTIGKISGQFQGRYVRKKKSGWDRHFAFCKYEKDIPDVIAILLVIHSYEVTQSES